MTSKILSAIQDDIINALESNGPMTRSDLVRELNAPRTTIFDNLIKLQGFKRVQKFTRSNGKRGRPLTFWELVPGDKKNGRD